jgi:hypothetical protein
MRTMVAAATVLPSAAITMAAMSAKTSVDQPVDARTELIFELIASRAINIEIESVMATAKMTTTPIERMAFRNALRTPRRKEFTWQPFLYDSRHFDDVVKEWLLVSLSQL